MPQIVKFYLNLTRWIQIIFKFENGTTHPTRKHPLIQRAIRSPDHANYLASPTPLHPQPHESLLYPPSGSPTVRHAPTIRHAPRPPPFFLQPIISHLSSPPKPHAHFLLLFNLCSPGLIRSRICPISSPIAISSTSSIFAPITSAVGSVLAPASWTTVPIGAVLIALIPISVVLTPRSDLIELLLSSLSLLISAVCALVDWIALISDGVLLTTLRVTGTFFYLVISIVIISLTLSSLLIALILCPPIIVCPIPLIFCPSPTIGYPTLIDPPICPINAPIVQRSSSIVQRSSSIERSKKIY